MLRGLASKLCSHSHGICERTAALLSKPVGLRSARIQLCRTVQIPSKLGRATSIIRPFCSAGALPHTDHTSEALAGKLHHSTTTAPKVATESGTLISAALAEAALVLPTQAILENFVHHNPLHNFEELKFREAVEYVHQLEQYKTPGARLFQLVDADPRKRVNEALVDLCAVFLDRGAAKWAPRFRDKGFLYFFASLEGLGFSLWRRDVRQRARSILDHLQNGRTSAQLSEAIIREDLEHVKIPMEEWVSAIRSQLLELKGWAGMFHRMEHHPLERPLDADVQLIEFCAVQSILNRASNDNLARFSGWNHNQQSFADYLAAVPPRPSVSSSSSSSSSSCSSSYATSDTENQQPNSLPKHPSAIAYVDQTFDHREVLEQDFEQTLLSAISTRPVPAPSTVGRPSLQIYTCIDDRECSFRRLVEEANPTEIETFGVAGFFGIPIRYQPVDDRQQLVLAPEGSDPQAILVEGERATNHDEFVRYNRRRRLAARCQVLWENASFSPIGSLILAVVGLPFSIARLLLMGWSPHLHKQLTDFVRRSVLLRKPATDIDLPYTPEQGASMLARTFRDIGTHKRFAPIVMVIGHGSSSVNNPFAAAYNCGACGGREGGPNARLLARTANDPRVRACLRSQHDIDIPNDTVFVGGLHNTTAETMEFYDVDGLPSSHHEAFARAREIIDEGRAKNALERCRRFLLATSVHTPAEALKYVQARSLDLAEVRPELNHASNAGVVVGRRKLTKGRFLDRRVFLPSYDPSVDDDEGTNLEHVLGPALIVCSGINLEYLFSTADVEHHGAGTKAPLNIVGNIGVLQGTTGDLRPGLPSQMTEMHTPIRALYVIDAPVARVEAVLARRPELKKLVRNDWVRFVVRDPDTNVFYRHEGDGRYTVIEAPHRLHTYVSSSLQHDHGSRIARQEAMIYTLARAGMLISACALPLLVAGDPMNPRGTLIAAAGTMLSLPVLSFARRYLHGEHMFGRFSLLCTGLLAGFNTVALAPDIEHALAGWSLFGFASTFLIGAYNDRPTVRNNATFAFASYQISDLAMLVAAAFSAHHAVAHHYSLSAAGLLVAALFKSSQFPLTALFVRSMEGPTPASALGYAGLSAHVGVVFLTSTMPLWYELPWARELLAATGLITAAYGSLASRVRADRKGAIANATSATIGLIFGVLALGYSDLALTLSLGHAAFRMIQILRSPNVLLDSIAVQNALGYAPWPRRVPDWLYRLGWRCQRFHSDFHLINILHLLSRPLLIKRDLQLNRLQQTGIGFGIAALAGLPYTPLSDYREHLLIDLLQTHPAIAASLMTLHFGVSVLLMRFLFLNILTSRRFKQNADHKNPMAKAFLDR